MLIVFQVLLRILIYVLQRAFLKLELPHKLLRLSGLKVDVNLAYYTPHKMFLLEAPELHTGIINGQLLFYANAEKLTQPLYLSPIRLYLNLARLGSWGRISSGESEWTRWRRYSGHTLCKWSWWCKCANLERRLNAAHLQGILIWIPSRLRLRRCYLF